MVCSCVLSGRGGRWRTALSKASTDGLRDESLNVEWFTTLSQAREKLADWRSHYNHQRPHSSLTIVHQRHLQASTEAGQRASPFLFRMANGEPRQGFALPAIAALDPAHRLPEHGYNQGEALLRIAQTRDSLLSFWSNFQARQTGSGGT
jgi:hypothetical protein